MIVVLSVALTAAIGGKGTAEVGFSPPSPISPLAVYLPIIRGAEQPLQVYLPLVWR